jgi:hypothetical protein
MSALSATPPQSARILGTTVFSAQAKSSRVVGAIGIGAAAFRITGSGAYATRSAPLRDASQQLQ